MTTAEIETLLDAFHKAAKRIRAAGLDGIELQAFAASLAVQFMSPYTNKRTDQWGGSLKNRLRFTREMMRVCREALGPDRALAMKIAGDELVDGGLHLPEMQEIVRELDADRMIDFYVIASGNNMEKFARVDHWPPTPAPQALHANLAQGIRSVTSRPVAALARIVSPAIAERLIADGVCDMVAMVRANIEIPTCRASSRPGGPGTSARVSAIAQAASTALSRASRCDAFTIRRSAASASGRPSIGRPSRGACS